MLRFDATNRSWPNVACELELKGTVRPVTLGDWVTVGDQNLWVVETGIKPGDRVIIDGLTKLHPGAPIKLAGAAPAAPAGAPAKEGVPAKDGAKSGAAPKS